MNETLPRLTIEQQVACVQREIRMRERVYPRLVEAGRMTFNTARAELAAMRAVLETLENIAAENRLL